MEPRALFNLHYYSLTGNFRSFRITMSFDGLPKELKILPDSC